MWPSGAWSSGSPTPSMGWPSGPPSGSGGWARRSCAATGRPPSPRSPPRPKKRPSSSLPICSTRPSTRSPTSWAAGRSWSTCRCAASARFSNGTRLEMRRQELERISLLGEQDLYLFNEGSHLRLWEHLGAHPLPEGGVVFGVWAPSAERVSVIGDFNGWDREGDPLSARGSSGLWEGVVSRASVGDVYKFHIVGPNGYRVDKADPLAA